MSSADLKHKEEEEELVVGDDKDTRAYVAPIVKLQKVAITTGEEDEDPILDLKSKLYRFDKDENQWKERGADTMKFLKHKASGKVRLLMRQNYLSFVLIQEFFATLDHEDLSLRAKLVNVMLRLYLQIQMFETLYNAVV
ncbi:hypothetical protein JHK82_018877 [Glycine max]|nr:hypothetical protein JHK85_019319 [Glycine max]KAG5143182.1 hypothetical protein JHK82_018877 [Glycine max]